MTEYPVDTLEQIALIPDEALPRFLAEFPHMIQKVKKYTEYAAAVNIIMEGVAKIEAQGMIWVDDGKTENTLTIQDGDGGDIFSIRSPS